jgi:cellulose 1,4-beta-cellobiosidase
MRMVNPRFSRFVILVAFGCVAAACGAAGPAPSVLKASAADSLPPPQPSEALVAPAEITPPAADGNPFAGATFRVEPSYVANVERTAKAHPSEADRLRKAEAYATAIWVSSVSDVAKVSPALDAAVREQQSGKAPVLTAFTIYDLPDRDCSANASAGDLASTSGGERRYEREIVDTIAAAFAAHRTSRIVVFLEPDSLANLATNMGLAKCRDAERVYESSLAYAIRTLAMPNVTIYLDAAHAGWLGWTKNREGFVRIVADVLSAAGGAEKVRGFVTNVSNYDTLGTGDLATLEPSDPAKGEIDYVRLLDASLTAAGIRGKAFVVDTSRNGRSHVRTRAGSWCNVRSAGLGSRPAANPAPLVDAYFWVKPPGESDGASDAAQSGYDPNCGGPGAPDSVTNAPRAGSWFDAYFVELAKNADPSL